jgi:hypothetical protein
MTTPCSCATISPKGTSWEFKRLKTGLYENTNARSAARASPTLANSRNIGAANLTRVGIRRLGKAMARARRMRTWWDKNDEDEIELDETVEDEYVYESDEDSD